MSLSKYLQEPSFLKTALSKGPDHLRTAILKRGKVWLQSNPAERTVIENNLTAFGIDTTNTLVKEIQHNILLHYFEKLLPLSCSIETYADFLETRVNFRNAIDSLSAIRDSGRGVVLASAHIGAVEMITPCLSLCRLPVSAVLRFSTQEFSDAAKGRAAMMAGSGKFGEIRFIEIGNPNTAAALEMAGAVRRKDILVSMFDEETEYSIPVTLLGRQLKGGAGLNRLLKFAGAPVALCIGFMLRDPDDRYRFAVREIGDLSMQGLFSTLEETLKENLAQWYFLHEEIPFIKNGS